MPEVVIPEYMMISDGVIRGKSILSLARAIIISLSLDIQTTHNSLYVHSAIEGKTYIAVANHCSGNYIKTASRNLYDVLLRNLCTEQLKSMIHSHYR